MIRLGVSAKLSRTYRGKLTVSIVPVPLVSTNTEPFRDADRVSHVDGHLLSQSGGDYILRNVTCHVCG